ncbi:sphingosine-1-phosphate lyase-like [Haliotis rufescens]|uniref:sphingosine-1-phosphate lyase-like n=1 Tax=Haliotis rufescens TaxID=6454 RepID=UPI00201F5D31|nr:sphingosine-1-phosphate lyase-like [Haliotis rufescens]
MWFLLIEHLVFVLVLSILLSIFVNKGTDELLRVVLLGLKALPGVSGLLVKVLRNEATNFIKQVNLGSKDGTKPAKVVIPEKGIEPKVLLKEMEEMREAEVNHIDGKIFAYTYTLEDDHLQMQKDSFNLFQEKIGHSVDHDELVKQFQMAFLHENALNPMLYPSLRKMETEIVSMTANMLNGDEETAGFLTSGGTESVLMAVKTYRDRAQKLFPTIKNPEIIAPTTIHPVMDKAAAYFGLKVIHVPVDSDLRADVEAMEKAITPNTILLAASAPQFCHGIVDPIEELSNVAVKRSLPLHIDACFGGFMLPWVEKLGYPIPKWDFRCPGVTSISADVHKYGFTVKGASVIAYRNSDLRKYQIFTYAEWPGGLYGSPSLAGTRPGGNIAAAWASMKGLGVEGYLEKAKVLMDLTEKMKEGVRKTDGICIMGDPVMTCFAVGSADDQVDILAVADAMETRGWKIERTQKPNSFHCSILPHHQYSADAFTTDLESSVKECRNNQSLSKKGTAGMYGMMASVPDKAIINDFIKEFFSEVYKVQ